eukprot:TRINITY_DN430_c0_g1_i9.p2 TRINITY_DN430_c0_g1~~TRINITY_DN430_c0_g1_i9.p2  ORF type:complete len:178 (-),score=50.79 TRINITY_DN430_c0_g1_i9:282-815(-)
MTPLCVLDFYVYEKIQRSGFGKKVFEKMLECEGVEPEKLAYDRPSPKLIGFLRKHYGLVDYIPQNNNYVIFQDYFNPASKPRKAQALEQMAKPKAVPKSEPFHKQEGAKAIAVSRVEEQKEFNKPQTQKPLSRAEFIESLQTKLDKHKEDIKEENKHLPYTQPKPAREHIPQTSGYE